MIDSRQIGRARLSRVQEYSGPTHDPKFLYPDLEDGFLAANRDWLAPHHWVPEMNKLVVTMQSWVLHIDDFIIVIDTGVGNHKQRPGAARMHQLNTLYLEWLEAAGAAPDKVTHVLMTHMHSDHVGWNTRLANGEWVPTFPNARYLLPREGFESVKRTFEAGAAAIGGGAANESDARIPEIARRLLTSGNAAFADSIQPLLQRGLVDTFESTDLLLGCLQAEPAPGHMTGQVSFHLDSDGQHAMFCGDVMHSVIQIARPELNTCFDSHPDVAREVRKSVLARAAERNALFLPQHLGYPYCGYVRRSGGGFAFEPSHWNSATDR